MMQKQLFKGGGFYKQKKKEKSKKSKNKKHFKDKDLLKVIENILQSKFISSNHIQGGK